MLSRTLRALRLGLLALVLVLAAACADGAPGTPRAPLSQDQLAALLVQDGDLPAGVSAEPLDRHPDWLAQVPTAPLDLSRRLAGQQDDLGAVSLFVYPAGTDLATVYTPLSSVMEAAAERPPQFIGSIGERSGIVTTSLPAQPVVYDLIFLRCSAAVYIRLRTSNVDDVLQYARRLDQRIQQRVCP